MRLPPTMTLLAAASGAFLASVPGVEGVKAIFDLRTGDDYESDNNCVDSEARKVRYLQIEGFDYNSSPWMQMTWRQLTDECGNAVTDGFSETVTYDGDSIEDGDRLQMDMYICAPWGNYELELVSKSTNGGNAMEKIAWEVEYGPDEYHIWDTLNTPFFDDSLDYAPIPSGSGEEETFTFPLEGSEGYYSVMYSGPFPPLECSNLHPSGITYEGCYSAGIFGTADGPTGSANDADPAENYRMFDGIDDDGVNADKVMTLEKCAATCTAQGTRYFGLESAVKCLCGDELVGSPTDDVYGDGGSVCGIDITFGGDVPEYKYLCSGDSRVLCGTDDHISVYSLDGSTGGGDDDSGDPPVGSELIGCVADSQDDRVMSEGPMSAATMSAEICLGICSEMDSSYTHFGTQYGEECWCTGSLGTTEASTDCTYPCAGNAGETCGGFDALTLYEIVSEAPPTPAPLTPPGPTPAPASPVVPSGDYDFVGCVADSQSSRVMPVGPLAEAVMSAEICFGICSAQDDSYTHFGTQYGEECWCTGSLGTTEASTDCTYPCAGNLDETCGGYDALSVYEIVSDVVTTVDPTPTPWEYSSLGCFADLRDGSRAMETMVELSELSAEICYNYCIGQNPDYQYFGLQYAKECWCSTSFSEQDEGVCDMVCEGSSDGEFCGGFDAIEAFAIN